MYTMGEKRAIQTDTKIVFNGCLWEIFLSRALDRKFWLNFKQILIENHYKTFSYQSECCSPTVM